MAAPELGANPRRLDAEPNLSSDATAATSGRPFVQVELLVVPLTILAFAVAWYRLGTKGLWLDEAISVKYAREGLGQLWTTISGHDPNMALYYFLLHFWVRVFGQSEAAVRSMSVVVGGLAIPVMVALGKRVFGLGAGLVAGLLLATSPFFLQYEQTGRSYSLLVLLVLLSSYFFVAALERPGRAAFAGWVLASVLAVYAQGFAAFVLMVQLGALVAIRWPRTPSRDWLIATTMIVVLCVPAAIFIARSSSYWVSWVQRPSLGALFGLPSALAGGRAAAVALGLLCCIGVVYELRRPARWKTAFLAAWLVLPPLLVFIESRVHRPLFVDYCLIIVLPAFLLLAAVGVTRLPSRLLGALAAVVVVALFAIGIRQWYIHPTLEAYRGATHYILANARRGDRIAFEAPTRPIGPISGVEYYEQRDPRALAPSPVYLSAISHGEAGRVWLVVRDSDVSPARRRALAATMAGAYELAAQKQFRNLTVTLYIGRSSASGRT